MLNSVFLAVKNKAYRHAMSSIFNINIILIVQNSHHVKYSKDETDITVFIYVSYCKINFIL